MAERVCACGHGQSEHFGLRFFCWHCGEEHCARFLETEEALDVA